MCVCVMCTLEAVVSLTLALRSVCSWTIHQQKGDTSALIQPLGECIYYMMLNLMKLLYFFHSLSPIQGEYNELTVELAPIPMVNELNNGLGIESNPRNDPEGIDETKEIISNDSLESMPTPRIALDRTATELVPTASEPTPITQAHIWRSTRVSRPSTRLREFTTYHKVASISNGREECIPSW